MKNKFNAFPIILVAMLFLLLAMSNAGIFNYIVNEFNSIKSNLTDFADRTTANSDEIEFPKYEGEQIVILNNSIPYFTLDDINKYSTLEKNYILSKLDYLKRAGQAVMLVGPETLNFDDREDISNIYPSGFVQAKYEDLIDNGGYLYNRCHLLAHCLSGLNADERNLITCTRQTNAVAMLSYEVNIVAYVNQTQNHVLYRVTPLYEDKDLVANSILLEALSVEDNGLSMCVLIHNVQDGITINYKTGASTDE